MKDTRLIKILKSLSSKELKYFGHFVNSPFLKPSRKNTLKLFSYIYQFSKDYDLDKMSKEDAFNYIFGIKTYDEKQIQNLIFDLTNSAEDYLSLSTLLEDELEFMLNLSKAYMRKNLSDESHRVNLLIEKNLKSSFSPFTDYFSKLKRLNNLKFVHYNSIRNLAEAEKSLEVIFEASILLFIFEYMNFIDYTENPYNQLLSAGKHRNLIQTFRQLVSPNLLLNLLKSNGAQNNYLKLHYLRFKLILDRNNFENFIDLQKFFFSILNLSDKDKDYLNRDERNLFFLFMINYCITQLSNDEKKYKSELLNLYKKMLESDSFSSDAGEYINVTAFRNIIMLCNSQTDNKFLIDLLDKYIICLHPSFREDMRHAGFARMEFIRKQFENSLEYLSMIKNYSIPMLKSDIKHLQLKCYYELSYFEQAYSLIDTYKSYLSKTDDIDHVFKIAFRNFVEHCHELLRLKSGYRKNTLWEIKKSIIETAHPGFKSWLLDKVAELEVKSSKCNSKF